MKTENLLLLSLVLASIPALAADKGLNGGDICEDRFQVVSSDLASWIEQGGSAGLVLPAGVSINQYNSKMTSEIKTALVSCTDDKVMVGSAEKTCENFVDSKGQARIVCDSSQFMATDESQQYVLVHHEYAGLAGFEVNDGETSNYPISNQITGFLAQELVKKLVVKPTDVTSGLVDAYTTVCDSVDHIDPDHEKGVFTVIWKADARGNLSPYPVVTNLVTNPVNGTQSLQTINQESVTCGVDTATVFGYPLYCPFSSEGTVGDAPALSSTFCYPNDNPTSGPSGPGSSTSLDLLNTGSFSFSCNFTFPSNVVTDIWFDLSNCRAVSTPAH